MRLLSWNVNGLRAVLRKRFLELLEAERPDVLCLQETKCCAEDLADRVWPAPYRVYFNAARKKGYSGTAILTRSAPLKVTPHMGIPAHDREGRVLTAEYPDFYVVNVYVPNAKRDLSRLSYRQRWDADFLRFLKKLERKKPVVFCGDLNVAHTELDLTYPKANVKNHGFTIEERAGMDAFIRAGFLDTFREFERERGHYTWWRQFGGARERNVGWRIDYFLISKALRPRLRRARILNHVEGSDHCPVAIDLGG
jgi:exodeoxyribonuclease-3